jgi:hypothetical protein
MELIGIINLPATKKVLPTAMPLWDSTGITSTGVKTLLNLRHYGSGAGEANQAYSNG